MDRRGHRIRRLGSSLSRRARRPAPARGARGDLEWAGWRLARRLRPVDRGGARVSSPPRSPSRSPMPSGTGVWRSPGRPGAAPRHSRGRRLLREPACRPTTPPARRWGPARSPPGPLPTRTRWRHWASSAAGPAAPASTSRSTAPDRTRSDASAAARSPPMPRRDDRRRSHRHADADRRRKAAFGHSRHGRRAVARRTTTTSWSTAIWRRRDARTRCFDGAVADTLAQS